LRKRARVLFESRPRREHVGHHGRVEDVFRSAAVGSSSHRRRRHASPIQARLIASPRSARHTLLGLTFVLSLITFIDRVAIGTAAPAIREQLHIGPDQMGWIFSAFTFAYAAFEIPSGWLGDLIGPRKTLMRIVLWWSAFTTASGLAWSFTSLLVARFLFGVGEAGAYPNISRSFARWFPVTERGAAHGAVFMSSRIG